MPGDPRPDRLTIMDIVNGWRPGSGDHSWRAEAFNLWQHERPTMSALVASILRSGLPGPPILLGDDGRVWDGHHRIVAAVAAGLQWVPVDVEYGHTEPPPSTPVWWAISGDEILDMLRRVAAGEDPDLVYTEFYANCDVTRPGDDPTEEAPDA